MSPTSKPDPSRSRPRALRPDTAAPEPTPPANTATPHGPRRRAFGLETVLLASTAALVAAVAWPIAAAGWDRPMPGIQTAIAAPAPDAAPVVTPAPASEARVQIALLLDTSSSMDGLIDQARSQLWRVVNTLDSATYQGGAPQVEIAVYEYGNDGLPASEGHIRQVLPFTGELDRVSEALFGLTTQGGSEFTGQAIAQASSQLEWSSAPATLRVLYIAGNEEFTQGPTDFREAIASAKGKGIVVNTINCVGGASPDLGWAEAATLGGGKFFSIDQDAREVYIAAPQDDEIAALGTAINKTYLYYGSRGADAFENQAAQDNNAVGVEGSSNVMRQLSKGSVHYKNPAWDLVDGLTAGTVTLTEIDRRTLPSAYRQLSDDDLRTQVSEKKAEREQIRTRLTELKQDRATFLAEARAQQAEDGSTRLDDAIISTLIEQAAAAGFTVEPVA